MKYLTFTFFIFIGVAIFAQEEIDPALTEDWSLKPEKVTPGTTNSAPSDAIVLFDKENLEAWESAKEKGAPAPWYVLDDMMVCKPKSGDIKTKQSFGSCQLHIEWMSPIQDWIEGKTSQNCGNSGIYLMSKYEVQVLNSFANETYYNGMAGSIYKQSIPLVNAARQVGKWQTYDIIFTAPQFNDDGTLKTPAHITVLWNGVLVQNHFELIGPTEYRGVPKYQAHESKLPILLQDHNNTVSYRNIWIREL